MLNDDMITLDDLYNILGSGSTITDRRGLVIRLNQIASMDDDDNSTIGIEFTLKNNPKVFKFYPDSFEKRKLIIELIPKAMRKGII